MCLPSNENEEKIMKFNVGTIDRVIRVIAGAALVGLAATGTVGVWGWIGVVPLATGLIKFCPAYALIGVNTCPAGKK
jgi:Inner membrane protein YgaP-like, transmembrane domain